MDSVKTQILKFLRENTGEYPSGELQRMEFKSKGRGLASGDTIKRKLNLLVQEGLISVKHERGIAIFYGKGVPASSKPRMEEFQKPDGSWAVRQVLF